MILGSGLAYWLVQTSRRNRWIVLASVMVGMTISIRILGPAALGLVAVYAIIRLRHHAIVPLLACLGIGLVVAYFTWPYLWGDPITRFWESLKVMANFQFDLPILAPRGRDVSTANLPWYYLPKLMAIQLTLATTDTGGGLPGGDGAFWSLTPPPM